MADTPPPTSTDPTSEGSVTRDVRHLTPTGARRGDRSVLGILLISLGVLFLLDNLNLIEARSLFRNFWPLLVVAWGAARLTFGRGAERIAGAVAVALGGLLLGNRLLGWNLNVAGLFWPIVLIALGVSMLNRWSGVIPPGATVASRSGGSDGPNGILDQSASISETAIMTGVKRRSISQAFRGGRITTVMGSVDLDLRGCRLSGDSARIDIEAVMGHVVLRVPRDWAVESHLSAVMGNIEDRSDRTVEPAPKCLVLEGTVFMGHVEIGN